MTADVLIAAVALGGVLAFVALACLVLAWKRRRATRRHQEWLEETYDPRPFAARTHFTHLPEYRDTHRRVCEAFDLMGEGIEA